MPRIKKSRKAKGFIDDRGPSRQERLADPDSYDSRKRTVWLRSLFRLNSGALMACAVTADASRATANNGTNNGLNVFDRVGVNRNKSILRMSGLV